MVLFDMIGRLRDRVGRGRTRTTPRHIAFLMDGNRRWARQKRLASPSLGHRHGATRAVDVLRWCREMDVQYVTVFAASIDNLTKRDTHEINALMNLIEEFVAERLEQR